MIPRPTLADLRHCAAQFNAFRSVDTSWLRFRRVTEPAPDLGRADHRSALLTWLNSWGCRIRYPRPGEPDAYDSNVTRWWHRQSTLLPSSSISELTAAEIDALGTAYAELAALPVAAGPRGRTLGPTAATKALYALRPTAVMPWDAAIAARMYGNRDADAFVRHLTTGREWARELLREAGTGEADLPTRIGRPAVSLAKVLDEYLYLRVRAEDSELGGDLRRTVGALA
ncbi:hypothetical protein AWW66_08275 [Micromonospora rosaria]|uniref:Uncharacterized protein n=1 Tax=Micromonospora rosaria TaxID=47874 RepID=A0A136PV68_9ACTN|nr:hypothetical protein [Micromonospora rosaria]KXK62431.1 hypothetical protein AWW66_08275 [Micromonospora rosaria]